MQEVNPMSEQDKVHRTVLPIPDRPHVGLTTYDAKDPDTKYPPIRELRPPAGAPNVLLVLIDDVGFGASSVFGGPCQTPNFEKLAANGFRYNRFHTTAARDGRKVGDPMLDDIAVPAKAVADRCGDICEFPIHRAQQLFPRERREAP
jgi:hypothetical protein